MDGVQDTGGFLAPARRLRVRSVKSRFLWGSVDFATKELLLPGGAKMTQAQCRKPNAQSSRSLPVERAERRGWSLHE
jgi:hypothetical protein